MQKIAEDYQNTIDSASLLKTKQSINQFQSAFLQWYEAEKRDLPWRRDTQPYHVWVSEIMLQQTRVETVIPYYLRFMEKFPTIQALAEAPEEEILKAWEGLGYYSRVRNMQKAAQQVMSDFDGKFPETAAEIRQLKGIGPYTSGAIASISFHLPEPAIDGNALRVTSRLFCIGEDIAKPKSLKVFDIILRQLIAEDAPGDFNQAMMDLGSQICTPTSPKCPECPVASFCLAFSRKTMLEYPVKSKKMKPKPVYYLALAIEDADENFLLQQRANSGLLANMWTFPLIEVSEAEYQAIQKSSASKQDQLDLFAEVAEENSFYQMENVSELNPDYQNVIWQKRSLGEVTHVFSHLKWHVAVLYGRLPEKNENQEEAYFEWVNPRQFSKFVFPTAQKKIVNLLVKEHKMNTDM